MSNSDDQTTGELCPQCGAEIAGDAKRCWLCGVVRGDDSHAQPAAEMREKLPQFGIASLMLTITLAAVLLALMRWLPGLGFGILVFVTPAFVRAVVRGSRAKSSAGTLSIGQKVLMFLAAFGLVVSVAMSAGLAFFTVCLGGFLMGAAAAEAAGVPGYGGIGWGLGVGITIGTAGQLVFWLFFVRWLWRRREQRQNRLGDIGFIFSWIGFSSLNAVLIHDLLNRYFSFGEAWMLGAFSLIGLVISAVALPRPHRLLASCGVGLGITTVMQSLALLLFQMLFASTLAKMQVIGIFTAGLVLAAPACAAAFWWMNARAEHKARLAS